MRVNLARNEVGEVPGRIVELRQFLGMTFDPDLYSRSLCSQGTHRISLRRPPRRQVAGEDGDDKHEERRRREGDWIGRTNVVNQGPQHAGQRKGAKKPARPRLPPRQRFGPGPDVQHASGSHPKPGAARIREFGG